ncbi:MAG TPA: sigma-70 family RNA polymerase sigma factor, partial [Dehalococcoidia bacterium]|nr:sigma-70 family RNA polymerase sigma factor [Dehalococcoidia bacterium]
MFDTDEDLLRGIAAGRAEALASFYDRYARSAYGLALRLVGSPEGAEEVVQEAFWRVWRGAGGFDPSRSKPATWLLSIVHHQAIDQLRRRRRRPDEAH